jgi:hypothetical protein
MPPPDADSLIVATILPVGYFREYGLALVRFSEITVYVPVRASK